MSTLRPERLRHGRLAPLQARLLARAERHLPALVRLRRKEALPIRLDRRRIYVLPSRFGYAFGVLLAVMLLGALNYGNNPALLLTCLLAAAAGASVFAGFRVLSGLALRQLLPVRELRAGQPLALALHFDSGGRARPSLYLRSGDQQFTFALAPAAPVAHLEFPATPRGWWQPGRLRLSTGYPLGVFEVWSWLNPDLRLLVLPQAEDPPPPLPRDGGEHGPATPGSGDDELAGLREYRPGDPPRRIAWKASTRHDRLLARELETRTGQALVLDYNALAGLDQEARIRRLAAWVDMAAAAGSTTTLHLPAQTLGPAAGEAHRLDCLRALALLPP